MTYDVFGGTLNLTQSISCCIDDLRCCLPTTSVTGVQQSTRYCGALPRRRLFTMTVQSSAEMKQCKCCVSLCVGPGQAAAKFTKNLMTYRKFIVRRVVRCS